MQGKGAFVPSSLIDNEKAKEMISKSFEHFLESPEKFVQTNFEYTNKFRDLITLSINKFWGKQEKPLYTLKGRDKRFRDPVWQENIYNDFRMDTKKY